MPSKRNSNVVIFKILEVCIEGASKTRIIYQANLNFKTGAQYLDGLMKNGFIEAIPEGSRFIYKTTPKGMALQEKLGQYLGLIDHLYSKL